jgi:drug/metabolite transporter (DMT)-like permease
VLHTILGCLFVAIGGFTCAGIMQGLRAHTIPSWVGYASGIIPMLAWNYMARMSPLSMPYVTMLFEVTLTAANLVAFFYFGFRPSMSQGLGMVLALVGLALMAKGG